ncbi:Ap4A phosphorylase II [Xylariales sp. AK1849]|nr:Ap4A phosphorylase II [Xylariales sp. AK1849]
MADMSPIRVPSKLPSLVTTAFARAKAGGDLTYYPTQVAVLKLNSIPFQLRFSPSLASKPQAPKPKEPNAKPFNPFESPLPSMKVADLTPSHVLVLNKFAIVPEHFILATKTVKPQTHVLERDDISAAYACIQAYRDDGQELFAFFNSGPHSGASQPHRHLQLLPVEHMKAGLENAENGGEWGVLAEKIQRHQCTLPFTVLTEAIAPGVKADALHEIYANLYKRAVKLIHPGEGDVPAEGEAKMSYNMAMTSTVMALCPRVAEGASIQDGGGEDIGSVALNGTVLGGTALVKNQAEWDALREHPEKLLGVLEQIGVQAKRTTEVSM